MVALSLFWITKNNYVTNKTFLNKHYLNMEM